MDKRTFWSITDTFQKRKRMTYIIFSENFFHLILVFSFFCVFRIGNDRFKSKVIYETLCPRWLEQFDLNLSEDQVQEMEVTVWDKDQGRKDDFMGR